MVDRNPEKAALLRKKLLNKAPYSVITNLSVDLSEIASVKQVCSQLCDTDIDFLIHNAGAYKIPRKICSTGLDNIFQINFASPYFITRQLMPVLAKRQGKVIVVGSIAHTYSKTDPNDVDFATRKPVSLVYGNAKRYLMFSMFQLSREQPQLKLAVVHPGITVTNITAHYPKLLYTIIKYPMKLIFMSPKNAALNIIEGFFHTPHFCHWIGPRFFNLWGLPAIKKLKTCSQEEILQISQKAKEIYLKLISC